MRLGMAWNRRSFLRHVRSDCRFADGAGKAVRGKGGAKLSGFGSTGNPYEELGVTTVINCEGTMTMLGGSMLRPELEAVMAQAGRHFVAFLNWKSRRASESQRCSSCRMDTPRS